MRALPLSLFAFAILLATGCRTTALPDGFSDLDSLRPVGPTRIAVDNENIQDLTIWVFRSAQRHRLGTIDGFSSRTFRLPPALVGAGAELQFLANPLGDATAPVSHVIFVEPGELVELVIPPQSF